jgi:transcription initiation factor TFIIB
MFIGVFCVCENVVFDYKNGYVVCADTGEVVDTIIDFRPGRRRRDRLPDRPGEKIDLWFPDSNMATDIGWSGDERTVKRLRKLNKRTRFGEREKKFLEAIYMLMRFANTLNLPNKVFEEAAMILRRGVENRIIPITNISMCHIATAIIVACRAGGVPITARDVADIANCSENDVINMVKTVSDALNIRAMHTPPEELAQKLASELNMSAKAVSKAIDVIKRARDAGLVDGKHPAVVAATAVYVAGILTDEYVTQKNLAKIANVSEVSIRHYYKEFMKLVGDGVE